VADDVKRGDRSRRVELAGTDEAAHVAMALNRMLDGMAAAQQAQIDSEQRLHMALDAADMRAWRWDGATDSTEWDGDPQGLLGPQPAAGYAELHQMVVPEDRAGFVAAGRAALAGAADYRVEFRLRRTDGQVRWLVTRGSAMRDPAGRAMYLYGITQDVTAHKVAEQLLHDSEARANLIIDGSPDALLIVGEQGRILRINSRAEAMFGYTAAELLGQSIETLVPPDARHRHPQDRAAFVAMGSMRVMAGLADVRALRKDGSTFPAQVNLAALGSGPTAEVIATVRDETQSRALQADLVRHRDHLEELVVSRTVELTAARNEAERLARVKSEFLANMSHEIRTPLNAVLGLAQIGVLNRAGTHSKDTLRVFAGILQAGQHLLGVINDILDFSRLDAGKLAVERKPFALAAAVDNAARMVSGSALAKGLSFDVLLAPDLPQSVLGDAQRLQQVLVNLLANAVKFTEAGAVQLRVARAPVGRDEAAGDDLLFTVKDAGIGMTAEQVQRLFLPFEQADSSATRRFGGSGLGLAISHNLAQLMGGGISVESAPGRGSSFTLRLPLPPVEVAGPGPAASPLAALPGPAPGGRLAGLHVLAAEDVEVNRMVLETMLEHEGARVSFAENGQQVLDRLQGQPAGTFDVILMDVQMPVMDGYEATRRVRDLAPDLPVIGLTAHALADERARCLAVGMSAHVGKPIDLETLVAQIRRCILVRG
jgi:PAS domain S-box-containing protein